MGRTRRSEEDLLNPDRAFFNLIRDYTRGDLTKPWLKLYRARVIDVAQTAGQLEENPPCPPNSIRARVYTDGLDFNIPDSALNIFYPLFPPHMSPPVEPGEHVYVIFEDENYSSGLWISQIPSYHDLNFANPDERESDQSNASDSIDPRPSTSNTRRVIVEEEYGGLSTNTSGRQEIVDNFPRETGENNPWRGKRIIHIGDSMVSGATREDGGRQAIAPTPYYLERTLINDYGAAFYRAVGRVGWGVPNWLSGRGFRYPSAGSPLAIPQPSVRDLINQYQADIVLCTLGGNDAGGLNSSGAGEGSNYENQVRQLWDEMKNGTDFAIWCGPPTAVSGRSNRTRTPQALASFNEKRSQVNSKILSVVGRNNFIDCRTITNTSHQRQGDGIHFRARADVGIEWARLFIQKGNSL